MENNQQARIDGIALIENKEIRDLYNQYATKIREAERIKKKLNSLMNKIESEKQKGGAANL